MITHFCMSIDGALRWPKREFDRIFKNCVKNNSGRIMSPAEVRAEFKSLLDKGVKVIPYGDCDNFDDQTGCQGHEEAQPAVQKEPRT